ncbi:MAG: OmpA family protein [bacterium]|nr:OmpA family protein [bacterium]
MKNNRLSLVIAPLLAGILLGLCACSTTPVSSRVPGYLTTPKGLLLMSQDGQCWRTAEWRPALAIKLCDPEVVQAREAEAVAKKEKKKEEEKKTEEEVVQEKGEHKGIEHAGYVFVPEAEQALLPGAVAEAAAGAATSPGPAAAAAATATAKKDIRYRNEVVFAPLMLNSDTSFRFGDDHLTSEGRDAVTEMAGIIKNRHAQDLKISVVGHTDRVGSGKANLDLSRRRAATVKAALIAEGIPANVIEAGGMGSSMPVTQADECPNYLVKCELIECLRPDRRVEIKTRGRMENGMKKVPVESRIELPRPLQETVRQREERREEMRMVCKAG